MKNTISNKGQKYKCYRHSVFALRALCCYLLIISIVFSACDKKDRNQTDETFGNDGFKILAISVENGSAYSSMIDQVRLISSDSAEPFVVANYNNGNFTFELPDNIADKYLFGIGYLSASVAVSNPNVKTTELELVAIKNGKEVGRFYFYSENKTTGVKVYGYPTFINSALIISGKRTNLDSIDVLNAKETINEYSIEAVRGWNWWYDIEKPETYSQTDVGMKTTKQRESTTTKPDDLKWHVEFHYYPYASVTAGVPLLINAQVENGSQYNDHIKRVGAHGYRFFFDSGVYENAGFSITLPNDAQPEYDIWDVFYGATISDENVKLEIINYVTGYSTTDLSNRFDDFVYGKVSNDSLTVVMYVFASESVTVAGTSSNWQGNMEYYLNLQAGWNVVYVTSTWNCAQNDWNCWFTKKNTKYSTTPENGLKWYLERDFERMPNRLSVNR
jgi:hypothetical protein